MSSARANAAARSRRAGGAELSTPNQINRGASNQAQVKPMANIIQNANPNPNPQISIYDAVRLIALRLKQVENSILQGQTSSNNDNNVSVDEDVFNNIVDRIQYLEQYIEQQAISEQQLAAEKQATTLAAVSEQQSVVVAKQQLAALAEQQAATLVAVTEQQSALTALAEQQSALTVLAKQQASVVTEQQLAALIEQQTASVSANKVCEGQINSLNNTINSLHNDLANIKDLVNKLQVFTVEINQQLISTVLCSTSINEKFSESIDIQNDVKQYIECESLTQTEFLDNVEESQKESP